MKSHLLEGKVHHRRVRPFTYDLRHGVYYLAVDLDELQTVTRRFRLLSRNRPNVLAFYDRDHLDPPADDLPGRIRAHLRGEGFEPAGWSIMLVTNLRVLGYVFNPASFYLCRDRDGNMGALVVEVHNTYGERHLYTLRPEQTNSTHVATMAKAFYVSPFIEIAGGYVVRFYDYPDGLRIAIDQRSEGAPLLHTSLALRRLPLSDRNLARLLLRHPLVTLKTIAAIHWHAFRLWRRGARFHRHGASARAPGGLPPGSGKSGQAGEAVR
ncbi:MAG TPA: DUF1365 domain-containing protein [Candidatus Limnocylindria bacterium]|nr:DUF1365 domain-containing protein [Candidatus Limnocylindria bacterium]